MARKALALASNPIAPGYRQDKVDRLLGQEISAAAFEAIAALPIPMKPPGCNGMMPPGIPG
jgi:hypothetical protein